MRRKLDKLKLFGSEKSNSWFNFSDTEESFISYMDDLIRKGSLNIM